MTTPLISADIIIGAARAAIADPTYDQRVWAPPAECATACCVLGRARALAGVEQINGAPQPGEIPGGPDGPLGRLLRCQSPGVARLLGQCDADAMSDGGRIVADGASLRGATLRGAKLDGASLVDASLRRASLVGATLRGALLDFADLDGADLRGADIRGARYPRAYADLLDDAQRAACMLVD